MQIVWLPVEALQKILDRLPFQTCPANIGEAYRRFMYHC